MKIGYPWSTIIIMCAIVGACTILATLPLALVVVIAIALAYTIGKNDEDKEE